MFLLKLIGKICALKKLHWTIPACTGLVDGNSKLASEILKEAVRFSFNGSNAKDGEVAKINWIIRAYGRFYAILESILCQTTKEMLVLNSISTSIDIATMPGSGNYTYVGAALTQSLARERYDIMRDPEDRDRVMTEVLECLRYCIENTQTGINVNRDSPQGEGASRGDVSSAQYIPLCMQRVALLYQTLSRRKRKIRTPCRIPIGA